MGFLDSDSLGDSKNAESEPTDGRKWIIFTAQELLYVAPNHRGEVLSPRQGRWEVGANGAAPAPTVNLQPLPAPFQLSGWKGPHSCLNGEYMPSDDGSKLLNNRPIFKHAPIVVGWKREDRYRMYWSHGAWRISDKDKLQSDQAQCMAFAKNLEKFQFLVLDLLQILPSTWLPPIFLSPKLVLVPSRKLRPFLFL